MNPVSWRFLQPHRRDPRHFRRSETRCGSGVSGQGPRRSVAAVRQRRGASDEAAHLQHGAAAECFTELLRLLWSSRTRILCLLCPISSLFCGFMTSCGARFDSWMRCAPFQHGSILDFIPCDFVCSFHWLRDTLFVVIILFHMIGFLKQLFVRMHPLHLICSLVALVDLY
jgi:hypothetical protein